MLEMRYGLSLLLSSSLAAGGLMAGPLSAQQPPTLAQKQITFLAPNAAQRQQDRQRWGRPTTRTPGGTRDRCAQTLIALVPSPEMMAVSLGKCLEESVSDRALTLTETPTLWFYIPQLTARERQAELVLLQDHREVDRQRVTLPAVSGILGVQLQQPLTANRLYGWSFSILQQPHSPSQNPTVEGLIRYVASRPADTRVLPAPDQLRQYAEAGIWHDTLTALVQQRCQNPASQNWNSFLGSAGLDAIATAPILNCRVLR
jgi:hypothetical protein